MGPTKPLEVTEMMVDEIIENQIDIWIEQKNYEPEQIDWLDESY